MWRTEQAGDVAAQLPELLDGASRHRLVDGVGEQVAEHAELEHQAAGARRARLVTAVLGHARLQVHLNTATRVFDLLQFWPFSASWRISRCANSESAASAARIR